MGRVVVLLLVIASLPGAGVRAQPGQFEGQGTVIGLDVAAGTVTLDHGPIPGLMPAMRMRLSVAAPAQLGRLKVGDQVRFSLGSRGDEIAIVSIEPLDQTSRPPR